MRVLRVFAIASTLFLAACGTQSTGALHKGVVVNCESIMRTGAGSGLDLPCLGGGSDLHFNTLRGPLIVNVWGSWCAPCREEIPIFRSFYSKAIHQKSTIQLLGVDVEEAKRSDGTRFIVANGMSWPSLVDPDGRSRGFFGMGVPVTWFIDEKGVVVHKKIGVIKSEKELRDLTRQYLHITIG